MDRHDARWPSGAKTFDFMGLGDFKVKFGAELDNTKIGGCAAATAWLSRARDFAERGCSAGSRPFARRIARFQMFGVGPAQQMMATGPSSSA